MAERPGNDRPVPNEDGVEEDEVQPSGCCFMPWRRSGYSFSVSRPNQASTSSQDPVCLAVAPLRDLHLDSDGHYEVIDESTIAQSVVVTQIDYVNFLIPGLSDIVNCPFYWGKIDRYEAEALLENKPEGSFLLRDSAQDDFVFSVSFRRYNRSLHARIEESKHRFSFDCHDPGVHSATSIIGLLDSYTEPQSCMFFEPMLLHPIPRRKVFSLQELARAAVCDNCTYNGVSVLPLPKTLKDFLRDYSYKHKIRSRQYLEAHT